MNYRLDANPDVEPSLAEMALTALNILEKNSNGYFLLIEGEIFIYFFLYKRLFFIDYQSFLSLMYGKKIINFRLIFNCLSRRL